MKRFARNWILPFVDPRSLLSLVFLPRFFRDIGRYRGLAENDERIFWVDTYPCLGDRLPHTPFDPHYLYQGAWLARRLAAERPAEHVDIGSSVMMVSVLSAMVPTVAVDFRPLKAELEGVRAIAGDITALPFADGSVASLSCLHVIEHIGLGRYGDPLDPRGSRRAAAELARVLHPGGRLYVSVPVGRERVCFNAHRVFAAERVPAMFPGCRLAAFSLVDDKGRFTRDASLAAAASLDYGCGMFELRKDS